MPTNSPTCVVLVPSLTGSPLPECEERLRLRVLEGRGYAIWRLRGFESIETARSQAATDATSKGFDELIWIDGDVVPTIKLTRNMWINASICKIAILVLELKLLCHATDGLYCS